MRCNKKQLLCVYGDTPPAQQSEFRPADFSELPQDGGQLITNVRKDGTPSASADAPQAPEQATAIESSMTAGMRSLQEELNLQTPNLYIPPDVGGTHPAFEADSNAMHDFLQTIMGGQQPLHPMGGHMSGLWTPINVFDLGQDTNLELNDLDLGFLNDYNHSNPFPAFIESPEATSSARESTASDLPSALAVPALQKASTWRFVPVTEDTGSNEQHNLSLPVSETNKRLPVNRRMTTEPLVYNTRDKIMARIISSCKDGNVPWSVLCFPSVELLDSLLQFYLSSATATSNCLFHVASFTPSKMRPELVTAMIAAGATLIPDKSIQKVGYALQESLRKIVPSMIEEDNTLIGDLQCIQSIALCLAIGLWSGNSRKMEIAESFLHPYVTMVRRRGWFQRSAYKPIVPFAEDTGPALEEKWQAWIEQESRKRLVFFFFDHDAKQSISMFTNPLISYAELGLPLPEPQALWLAPTAEKWKHKYIATVKPNQKTLSLVDLLNNVDLLGSSHCHFDDRIASETLLSAAWRLVWEYRQLYSVTKDQTTQWSSSNLLLSSRLGDLTKLLHCFRMSAPERPAQMLGLELLQMHLHVPLEDVILFAGAESHEEAQRIYPQLLDWVRTSEAREAVFRAAQIVAVARKIPPTCLRDFLAIAVYQAGLTMWSYDIISSASVSDHGAGVAAGMNFSESLGQTDDIVLLDESNNHNAQRFIALNRGRAAIRVFPTERTLDSYVTLSDPGATMTVLMDLLKANHKSQQLLPPLLENLLMHIECLRVAAVGAGHL